ncbi:DUF6550 family protein [Lutispora saccharofermentans]|uniref:Uncharacterized protein n=1 Tax=Lutispora saccharofermentans TaxID=3024236 RepID=A0ABT1NFT1_9FIRM|nr:DUF6550 family protein [Lutispora saccharofermentans]MCQ1530120.1 hypothetical protein [Lutispora saccharofermentans]
MKLTDKTKKRLTIAGLGVVCVVLVIAIASQFEPVAPKGVSVQPSSTVSDEVNPADVIPSPSTEVTVPSINPTESSALPADTGDSTGTEQSIQAEVTKPTEPPQEVKTDPSKTPDGQEVDKVTPVEHDKVTKPENPPSGTPESGDKKDGKIYVPGFGWIDDNGGGVQQNDVGSDGDINKQVGNMD